MINILAIESSCDDTSAAVIQNGIIKSNVIYTQVIHQKYGGVVPEMASRAHLQKILPVVDEALKISEISKTDLSAIAFTSQPGLIGSLLVGVNFAKSMALSLKIPFIDIDHMKAHILANLIEEPKPKFPFLCVTISGGHTQLVLCKNIDAFEIVGQTIDDAAGEAFDKAAKMLNLPYPGGPLIDKYAKDGDGNKFLFTKPKIENFDFSFSGIKTSILYFLQKQSKENPDFIRDNLNDLCASIQKLIVDILIDKTEKAAIFFKVNQVCIAGGVSANSLVRMRFKEMAYKNNWNYFIPDFQYCTDNAGMIAIAAYYKYLNNDFSSLNISANARSTF